MSTQIITHVLCHRLGTELGEPAVFPTFELAYKAMEAGYTDALKQYDDGSYLKDETTIGGATAVIVTTGDWEEWTITECEMEIIDLREFATVFESYLSNHYTKFKEFAAASVKLFGTAVNLSGSLLDLRELLADAVSEAAAKKDGGGGV